MSRSLVTNYGLAHDRRFMVIDADTDQMIAGADRKRLALVKTGINAGTLFLHADHMPREELSLYHFSGRHRRVEVHGQKFIALDQGDRIASWFTSFLGREVRLVAVTEELMRSKKVVGIDMTISCHDSSSLHIVTENSLADFNRRLTEESSNHSPAERFRPNIILRGKEKPYEEDGWQNMRIGHNGNAVVLWARKRTERCSMVNNGSDEPLSALASYRKDHVSKKVHFGMYFFPFLPGNIGEGDEVTVNDSGDAHAS